MPRPRGRRFLFDATAIVDLALRTNVDGLPALEVAVAQGAAATAVQWAEALIVVQRRSRLTAAATLSLLVDLELEIIPVDQRTAELAASRPHHERRALADRLFLACLRHGRLGLSADVGIHQAAKDDQVQLAGVLVNYREPGALERLRR